MNAYAGALSLAGAPRTAVVALGCAFAILPFSPALVQLTAIVPPGAAVVPRPLAVVLLAAVLALGAAATVSVLVRDAARPAPARAASLALPLSVYVASWALAAACGLDPGTGLCYFAAVACAVALHVAIARHYVSGAAVATIFGAFFASGLAVSLLGLAMVYTRTPAPAYAIAHGRAGRDLSGSRRIRRVSAVAGSRGARRDVVRARRLAARARGGERVRGSRGALGDVFARGLVRALRRRGAADLPAVPACERGGRPADRPRLRGLLAARLQRSP